MSIVIGFIFGIAAASYSSSIIYRLPRGLRISGLEGIGKKPHCSHCGHSLKFYEYYSFINWFFCRGTCNYCQVPLSKVYFPSEALIIVLSTYYGYRFGFDELFLFAEIHSAICIIIGAFIYEKLTIPKDLVAVNIITGALYRTWQYKYIFPWLIPVLILSVVLYLYWYKAKETRLPYDKNFVSLSLIASIWVPLQDWYIWVVLVLILSSIFICIKFAFKIKDMHFTNQDLVNYSAIISIIVTFNILQDWVALS